MIVDKKRELRSIDLFQTGQERPGLRNSKSVSRCLSQDPHKA